MKRFLLLSLSLFSAGSLPAAERPLRVLSYNVGAIPFVHRFSSDRVRKIAEELAASDYDVVALQEVWTDADFERLGAAGFPFALRVETSLAGNGLATLSRWPVVHSRFVPFSAGGAPHNLLLKLDGDALCSKGVLAARLRTPAGEVDVYNTHLISNDSPAENDLVRTTQILELDRTIREFSTGRPWVLLGDMNFEPGGEQFELLRSLLGVQDPCFRDGLERCGATYGRRRIDYVFGPRASVALAFHRPALVRGVPMLLSDHSAGVEARLPSPMRPAPPSETRRPALRRARLALLDAAARMRKGTSAFWARWYFRWWNALEVRRLEALTREIDAELGVARAGGR